MYLVYDFHNKYTRQGSPLDLKPSDLDTDSRLWAPLINIIINVTDAPKR